MSEIYPEKIIAVVDETYPIPTYAAISPETRPDYSSDPGVLRLVESIQRIKARRLHISEF
jgi:hypothetical protein